MNSLICEEGFDRERVELLGSKLLIGNGAMGCRGTLEEFSREELCALTLAGLFDQNGADWREPVNAPHPFALRAAFAGRPLSVLEETPAAHEQWVDMSCACQGRRSTFRGARVASTRFVSMDDRQLLAMRYELTALEDGEARVEVFPDCDIWDLHGPHLRDAELRWAGDTLLYTARTIELGVGLALAQRADCPGAVRSAGDRGVTFSRALRAGETLCVSVYTAVCQQSGPEVENWPDCAVRAAGAAEALGFDALLARHRAAWAALWARTAVTIRGDEEAELALRHSMYLLLVSTPFHTDKVAIPARGLSGQVYKGAMFWDTELYMLPMYLASLPETARNLVRYRVHMLEGARAKAREYGCRGAFYAWESQENGADGCTEYNINDIFTGRPLRTYFRDKQIHISADVAYGIWTYFRWTGDESLLLDGGAEVLLECARFLYSWSYFKSDKGRYELLDVTGADEYHERVNNDYYTNFMAREALGAARGAIALLRARHPAFLAQLLDRLDYAADEAALADLEARLYVARPDPDTGLIEQYDGHFRMEDISPETLAGRIIKPNEYLGSPVGLAVQTQVIKQADVCLVTALFPGAFPAAVQQANFQYYEPRTEHGSSLSGCIYALAAARCGLREYAYDYFLRAASLDLTGAYKRYVGDLYIGGTHPAANGGSWMVAVWGFGGLSLDEAGPRIDPALPQGWTEISFPLCWRGGRFRVTVEPERITVEAAADDPAPAVFRLGGVRREIAPGTVQSVTLEGRRWV